MNTVTANPGWLSPATRVQLYVLGNLAFSVCVLLASAMGPAAEPRTLYLCLLMWLCSVPLLWMERLNDRYTLLGVFLAAYFAFYGLFDAFALFDGRNTGTSRGLMSSAEFAVLLGVSMTIVGYRLGLGRRQRNEQRVARDWPMNLVVVTGLVFWCVGTAADYYWQINFVSTNSFEGRSSSSLVVLIVARMLQPLGTIMLGYALVQTRNRVLLLVIVALMLMQMLVGFICNSKETAMRGLIVLILSAFLLQGRVPRGWLLAGFAFVVLAFPVFQAYRAEVIGLRGISRAAAAQDIGRSIKLAMGAKKKVQTTYSEDYKVPTFIERSALKPTMEMFIEHTGTMAEFQHGHTLYLYFTGFVPRFIWPDKPDSSVGKIVNRDYHVSENPDTYISATHLGEYYWNFGWPGIVAGMLAFGVLLGFINARCDLSEKRTLTRLLVLITTIYATIVRFEGSIALEYIVLTRSLLIIWVLHLLFARIPVAGVGRRAEPAPAPEPLIDAPQLLR